MTHLTIGDPAPWFTLPSTVNPNYHFDTVGGYRVVLSFLGRSTDALCDRVLTEFFNVQTEFKQLNAPFFGVLVDEAAQRFAEHVQSPSYCKLLWDFEQAVSQLYGVCQESDRVSYQPTTFVLNQNLQVVGVFPIQNADGHVQQVLECVAQVPVFGEPMMAERQAPVLFVPRVFDRELCNQLIQLYEADGGRDSGFMRQVNGKTVEILDPGFKQRRDYLISDPELLQTINTLILRRVKPEIEKAYQFTITRFERHLVACYDAASQGFFNRHRDNTTKGTAHRRFAMTLNLNTGDYEGGCLTFPEYGTKLYRPDVGEATIFSCSMLHEATPVTQGRRFAMLSFFYDDEGAKIRERNQKYVVLNANPTPQPESAVTATSKGFKSTRSKKRR